MQLHAYNDSKTFSDCDSDFNHRSVTGKLNNIGQTTRSDILFAAHQIAKYSSNPWQEPGEAILYLVRYLDGTRHLGLRFHPDPSQGFECYCDADFSGNWNREFVQIDPSTSKSSIWASKLQSKVTISTTKAEYIAMSMAFCDIIPIMD